MLKFGALRRIHASGLLGGRQWVATGVVGSHQGVAFTAAETTTRRGCSANRLSLSGAGTKLCVSAVYRREFHNSVAIWTDYPDHVVVPFPALSPTMESGTIAKWEIAEGEEFSAGSVIASIETDKATMDFEAQDDGILAKILKDGPDATDLPVGAPIAIVVEEPEDVAAFSNYVVVEEDVTSTLSSEAPPPSETPVAAAVDTATHVVGGSAGTNFLLPSARFLAESKYVLFHDLQI